MCSVRLWVHAGLSLDSAGTGEPCAVPASKEGPGDGCAEPESKSPLRGVGGRVGSGMYRSQAERYKAMTGMVKVSLYQAGKEMRWT